MVKLQGAARFLAACLLLLQLMPPQPAEAGMMKKGMMGGGGMGGSGVLELLAAGLLVKFLGEMKTGKGGRGGMGMTKQVPMPVFVPIQSMMGHGMMMNGGWNMMMGGD